ncbi:hypothetical protein CAOG_006764 [Capsaspora owczarzaki ATCC 30864]|uniref:Trafficking protein particle complex subunit 11 n=1 Tax=Capsaspora owczarzaki (strain ATCC 30864) TaxID=595528 RepID=A0A0D2X4P9_CAPO3|nr:hypothetical protein CAOG_006764 [Capsaspora owczarzaki ATCC 30864]
MRGAGPTSVAAVAASSQAQAQAASSPPRQPAPAAAAATAPTTPATTAPSTAGATTTTAAAAPAASVTLSVSIAATAAAAAALPSPLESLLPPEIVARPVPLVALVGVEAVEGPFPRVSLQEAIHSERLVEQIPVTYRPVSKDVLLLLPQRKERRDVESYSPPGILKGSWIHKHRQVIPAVAAYFVELEWDDPQWAACEQECAAVFDKLRQSTAGRATRHVLVLVQRKHDRPMPPLFVDERSNSMRRACQIPLVLSLSFAKPDLPAIKQNVAKLEKALIDMAYAYYRDEAKRLKQRKERLNKSLQQGMLARLFFKLAYFAEMRSDGKAAIKYYGSSYAYLKELAERDKNGMAAAMRASIVKAVAGLINYKLCRLHFMFNFADALDQFRKHVANYRGIVGRPELAFEHSAWLGRQYRVFAELFENALAYNLVPTTQSQHPGFYYRQAAVHAMDEKAHAAVQCASVKPLFDQLRASAPAASSTASSADPRGRAGSLTEEDSTVLKAILASSDEDRRKLAELLVDHSGLIITLLSMAREHFKKMRSARMTLHMAVHIAQEYCQAGEHERALKLFERIAVDYRKERWWPVLESVLTASLACAYLIGSVQDFVVLSLELIASLTKHAPQRSIRAQESLMRVLSNQVPFPPEPSELVLMPLALNDTPPSLPAAAGSHVDMGLAGVIPFIECKVIFAAPTSPSDAPVVMHLAVVSRCPLAVEGSRLNLKFNVPGYAVSIVNETDRAQASAVRDAARTKSRSASIASEGARRRHETQVFDLAVPFVDQDTSIPTTIAADLTFSPDQPKLFRLQFLPLDNSDRTLERALQAAPTHWTTAELERTPWPELVERPSTKIATRESQMDISITHTPPALVNEFYPVKLVFTSREKLPIYNVSVHLEFLQHRDATQGWTSDGSICLTPELAKGESYRTRTIALEKMEPEASQEQLVYLFSPKDIGEQILTVKMSYSVDAVADGKRMFACTCQKEHLLRVPFVLPFTLLVKLATAKFEPIDVKLDSVSPRDALLLTTETQSVTPWPISIVKTELIVDTKALRLEGALPRNEPTSLNQGDTMSESFALRVGNPSVASISLGYYKIHWLRRDRNPMLADQGGVQSDPSPSVTAIALPPVNVAYKAISIVPQIPASGHLNSPLEVSYAIVNHTPLTQEIELVMESNESFMFSGLKATHFRVLPSASTSVTYNLYPLQPGRLPLPHLSVKSVRQDAELTFRAMPEHVFILPPRPTNAPAADLAR